MMGTEPHLNECLLDHLVGGPLRTRVDVGRDGQQSQNVLPTVGRLWAIPQSEYEKTLLELFTESRNDRNDHGRSTKV